MIIRRNIPLLAFVAAFSFLTRWNYASGFAARGGGKKKKNGGARSNKGFGTPLPSIENVLDTFRTRMPDDMDLRICPCGSSKVYEECCGPLHQNERLCLTMTDVLRSRYSAFSLRNIKYVMDTTHEACRDYREDKIAWAKDLNRGGMFDSFDFVNLDAGPEEPNKDDENEGFVNFKVTLRAREDTSSALAGQEIVIFERSRFIRDVNLQSWSYASGDVRSDVAGLEGTKLNA
jgi:SEC-C motif-containing protein